MPKKSPLIFILLFVCFTLVCFVDTEKSIASWIEKVDKRSFSISEKGHVSIKNISGDIFIHSWEKKKVELIVTKRVETLLKEKAENVLEKIEVKIASQEDLLEIETRYPVSSWWNQIISLSSIPKVNYEIWLPLDVSIEIECVSGVIQVGGRDGDVCVKLTAGRVELDDIRGDVNVNTTSGDIFINNSAGIFTVSSVTGDIHITKARGSVSKAQTRTGDIWVELEEVNKNWTEMILTTTTGDINLFLPWNIQAEVDASTITGQIESEFEIIVQGTIKKRTLRGRIGRGGGKIKLRVTTGNIFLKKIKSAV